MQRIAAVVVLSALVACVAACGGADDDGAPSVDDVIAAVEGLEGDARTRALLERVEREGGQLTWYTSASAELADAAAEAFGDAYGVEVGVYRASGETLVPRLLEEAEAGFRGADVAEMNGLGMFNLNDRGLLVPYRSPSLRGVVPEAAYEGWTATSLYTFAATWNAELVSGRERPRTWEDLADERFRGRVGVEAGDVDWYKTLRDHWIEEEGKSAAEADALFAQIGRNARVVRGHTFLAQFTAAGEVAVAPNYAQRAQAFADEGAPIAWRPIVEPLIVQPNGIGLVERAPHPAAAVLFVDWLLSDGQELFVGEGAEPVRRDLSLTSGAERRVVDFASLAAEQQRWSDRFERLLALGEEVEEEDE